ncbi:MAG: C25 family cysteine peptidase [candidate division WOR-3 bacterium]|nr:C25 family cysteine peptidase [candidate division WOR-3 bacterium]
MRMLILSGKEALHERIRDIRPLEKALNEYVESRKIYEPVFCYYDAPNEYGIEPVARDAEAIREYVSDFEKKLGDFDFLLLLGGDEVIPFFRLENPCDDADESVLSDNPYASRDDNYVIPERACSRIPDSGNSDFMVQQLNKVVSRHDKSFGLTARVWQRSSENVYRPIGEPEELECTPPVTKDKFDKAWLQKKDYLYFNVHGSKLSANWYGQEGASYPVAMGPENVVGSAGIVASESCYGAYIIEKTQDNAISMKFLAEPEVAGFCGSTTIAYGPAQPPSSEADLLVKYFFEYLQQGHTLGESLRNAKLDFARKSLRRHGFLDDDDTKTLLQFVLYGDPTLRVRPPQKAGLIC